MDDKTSTSTKTKSNNDNESQEVRPYDILCGRSKNCFNNIGNRRFRITISMNVKKYDALPNRTERGKFIATLALQLKNEVGFRFVRSTKKKGRVELSEKEIQAKIGHALRDLSATLRESANAAAKKEKKLESTTPLSEKPAIVTPQAPERVVSDDSVSINGIKIPACPKLNNMKKSKSKKKISEDKSPVPTLVTPKRGNTSILVPAPERDSSLFLTIPETEEDLQDMPKAITAPSKKKMKKRQKRAPKIPSVISSSSLISPQQEKEMKFSKLEAAVDQIANAYDSKDVKDEDDDDYSFTPLRFDDSSQDGILDTVPMDLLPVFANENTTAFSRTASLPTIAKNEGGSSNFEYVLGLNDEAGTTTKDDNRGFFRKVNSFPEFHISNQSDFMDDQSSYPDMSLSSREDDAMIEKSLCDSIDCLSLDLDYA